MEAGLQHSAKRIAERQTERPTVGSCRLVHYTLCSRCPWVAALTVGVFWRCVVCCVKKVQIAARQQPCSAAAAACTSSREEVPREEALDTQPTPFETDWQVDCNCPTGTSRIASPRLSLRSSLSLVPWDVGSVMASRSMLIAPPSSHMPARGAQTPVSNRTPSAFPLNGVFGGVRTPAPLQPPPRTPVASQTTMYAQQAQTTPNAFPHTPHTVLQTPVKREPPTPIGFHTPAAAAASSAFFPSTLAASPSSAVGGSVAGSALASMPEVETAKLMTALNSFVLSALQQQSSYYITAVSTGRVVESKSYSTLLSQLQAQHSDPLALSRWYAALSKSVASLHPQHHAELLGLLYSFSYNEAASLRNVEIFINLLVAMCVGGNQIHAIHPALKTLVSSFIATNVPFSTISAASVSPALYGRPGDTSIPTIMLGDTATPAATATAGQFAAGGHELPTMDAIHDLVHSALTRLMQLLPSSPTVLFPLLVESFPHKRNDATIQLVYVKNLLRVSEYAGSLRDRILTTIIERMIHIDVEIIHQVDGDQEEEADVENDDDDESDMQESDDLPTQEPELMFSMSEGCMSGPAGLSNTKPLVSKRILDSRAMANKLDSLMCLMFEYLNLIRIAGTDAAKATTPKAMSTPQTPGALIANATSTPNPANSGNSSSSGSTVSSGDLCDEVFSSLLRVFERSILRTHNSRFLQFLLFYYCSFKHVYAESFLRYLMEKGFEVQTSAVERQNSALYIASFVARASFLRHASAIVVFEMLLKWTHAYTEYHVRTTQQAMLASQQSSYAKSTATATNLQVPEVGPLEASQHAVFYRMCQALFYIFCYRQSSFRDMLEQNPEILQSLRLDQLIFSPLNPLRFVSQTVIEEFMRVNVELGHVVQIDALVQRNHRLNQSSRIGNSSQPAANAFSAHRPRSIGQGSNGDSSGPADASNSATLTASRYDPNDIFFPFDPYQLKHSSAYIENLYITYQSEEEEEEEEQQAEEEEEEQEAEQDDEDDDVESRMDDDDRSVSSHSKAIRIGRHPPIALSSRTTSSPELDASVSSMSQSFSEHLSVASEAHPAMGSSGQAMSFEMESGGHLLHLPPPVLKQPKARKTKKREEEKTPVKKSKKSKKMISSSDDSDDDDAVNLGDHDLSFSPDSPALAAFAPLDDSPQIRSKRR